jgi:hypothetical protein
VKSSLVCVLALAGLALGSCSRSANPGCYGQPGDPRVALLDAACNTVGLKIGAAWRPRAGSTNFYVLLLRIGADGKLTEPPKVMESTPDNGDPQWGADRDEAINAVYRAQPFDVSAQLIDHSIEVRLDPRAPPYRR